MSINQAREVNYYGYKSINEMVTTECTPLLDILLKLSSAASNFASTANNVKNVSISDKDEIKDLLNLVFDISELSSKVEKLVEERTEMHIRIIKSGVFEAKLMDQIKENSINEAINISKTIKNELKD